ncbi:hypothetical protein BCR34DRAFT_568680 [Clohesyomyces aquaticus]|uniref:Uncharacterized protein n=1 Tax=Clohesyomyces aquaticus TaxID=1231657 RepID=A0A1Y1ZGM2_9PLEO|nr:hypothetical protein BCR34DRAFT_568680 [Clohesyomyces aquaticus]
MNNSSSEHSHKGHSSPWPIIYLTSALHPLRRSVLLSALLPFSSYHRVTKVVDRPCRWGPKTSSLRHGRSATWNSKTSFGSLAARPRSSSGARLTHSFAVPELRYSHPGNRIRILFTLTFGDFPHKRYWTGLEASKSGGFCVRKWRPPSQKFLGTGKSWICGQPKFISYPT